MLDIRVFIKNLGKEAPAYFDVSDKTIQRWVKTGNIPMKVAQRIYAANEAFEKSQAPTPPVSATAVAPPAPSEPQIDPLTKLPVGLRQTAPQLSGGRAVSAGGSTPDIIETNPLEQSFGLNMTRPGRVQQGPLPPMKLRDEGGQKIAFVEHTPPLAEQKNPDGSPKIALPPSIPSQAGGWSSNDAQPTESPTENVS